MDGNSISMWSPEVFRFLVQVSPCPSLHSKRTSNVCLVVFASPKVFRSVQFSSVQFLSGGDIELNLGPKSDQVQQLAEMPQLLYDVNDRSVKLEKGQQGLIKTIAEKKQNQVSLEKKDHGYQLQTRYCRI